MDPQERRTPREKKIRRTIVFLSTCQASLGAVIIATSFTAFACTSSEKIRGASPYWAGFTVLFTGSVGFLTWKQLSIISISIYTFLSAASVIVHLVATVLTGDSAGLLKSLHSCSDKLFEHACECCKVGTSCRSKYNFPSVRDCSILTGFLKDLLYGLCAVNVVCCLICLAVTVMGCTLVAQYSRYSQMYGFRWARRSGRNIHDHRYNWFPYPSDPINSIPPCAPPIYYPVQSNPEESGSRYRRPPTVFDPVDFPPPYTSREPSLAGTLGSLEPPGVDVSFIPQDNGEGSFWEENTDRETEYPERRAQILGETGYQVYDCNTEGVEFDIASQFDQGNPVGRLHHEAQGSGDGERELGSTSGVALGFEGVVVEDISVMRSPRDDDIRWSPDVESGVYLQLPRGSQGTDLQDDQEVPSANIDSDVPNDDVFTSSSSLGDGASSKGPSASRSDTAFVKSDRRERRHSCPYDCQRSRSDEVYCAHDEVYRSVVPPNVNPWARTMSERDTGVSCGVVNPRSPKRRANSIPCSTTARDRVLMLHKGCQTPDLFAGENSGEAAPAVCDGPSPKGSVSPEESGGLFHSLEENNTARPRRNKRKKRPRNNPGHILGKETGISKEISSGGVLGVTEPGVCDTRESNL